MYPPFAHCKIQGEWAELVFLALAVRFGWNVGRVHGDSARFDAFLERNGRVLRVQVKSVSGERHRAYPILTGTIRSNRTRRYTRREADFLAAYVISEDAWYLIPISEVEHTGMIYLRPHRQSRATRFECFRENWNFLSRSALHKLDKKSASRRRRN